MVIIRHKAVFNITGLCKAALKAECPIVEITLNIPGALTLIQKVSEEFAKDLLIGAGTVLSVSDAEKAMLAGANYIVSPILQEDVVRFCVNQGIPVFPGIATPTEAFAAHNLGATMVKLFPASTFGPSYIAALKAPLADLKVLAVGGVNADNVRDYLAKGADAVAVGSGSIKAEYIDAENWDAITVELVKVKAKINC